MGIKDKFISILPDKVKNFYFNVGDTAGSMTTATQIMPVMETNAKKINNYFAPVQLTRYKTDISRWRFAIKEMEYPILPYRVESQRIFQDTWLNGHVKSCVKAWEDLVLLKEYHICDDKNATDDEATKIIDTNWFRAGLKYILHAEAFGYSLIAFGDLIEGAFPNLEIVRRANISPDRHVLSPYYYVPSGIPFMDPNAKDKQGNAFYDWSLYVPTPSDIGISKCGYGFLYEVARYEIILRAIDEWNTTFCEIYGQPFRWGKTAKEDEERRKFEEFLDKMGSNPWIVTDKDEEIEYEYPNSSGTGHLSYDNLEKRKEDIITSIILGHKDAMSSSAGKMTKDDGDSPAEVAKKAKSANSCRFVEGIVNDLWFPKLIKLGIKIPVGKKFKFKNSDEEQEIEDGENKSNQEVAEIAMTMSQAGLKMSAKYFTDRTGIDCEDIPEPRIPQFSAAMKNRLNKTYGHVK